MPEVGSPPNRGPIVVAVLALATIGVLAYGMSQRSHRDALARVEASLQAVPLGVEAPRVALLNRKGEAVRLESYRGRLVFVNFWATWCGPCRAEMDSLVALRRSVDPADVAFVSIAEDDEWPPVDQYLAANPLPFDVYRDQPPRVEELFQTTAYPTSFVIDRDGLALYRFNGARDWDTADARELLAQLGAHLVAGGR